MWGVLTGGGGCIRCYNVPGAVYRRLTNGKAQPNDILSLSILTVGLIIWNPVALNVVMGHLKDGDRHAGLELSTHM